MTRDNWKSVKPRLSCQPLKRKATEMNKIQIVTVTAEDWGVIGNQYWGDSGTEDGRVILDPTPEWVIIAEDARGQTYIHEVAYPPTRETSALFLAHRVREVGEIDPTYWLHFRTRFGSPAWEADEAEAAQWTQLCADGLAHEQDAPDHVRVLL